METRVAKVSEVEEIENSTPSESSEEEELRRSEMAKGSDLPSEYWHIQKLIKYMKVGV
jgi:hypothetical protein